MATKARQQYFADETSLQKQRREFSIADSVQQKIDSVETGAQVNVIETVKVNGAALVPDANKAVDVTVPLVIDSLSSASTTDALSAKQGKVLYDYIQNIASRGRFLSNWDCATGLPITDPTENPYPYMAGDYYTVSNVAASGGTNYRPDGSSYISRQASTTVETDNVVVSDMYLYDGTNWLLLSNRQIAVDSSLSTTSTNPVENRVITNALNGKQDALTAGSHIDITSNVISATGLQEELTAGDNITIEDVCTTESDMKGPAPDGFHVPLNTEWQAVKDIRVALGGGSSDGTNFGIALKLPFAGDRSRFSAGIYSQGTIGYYWSSSRNDASNAYYLFFNSTAINPQNTYLRASGFSVRCFKNSPVVPTSSWTKLYGTSIEAGGIFWSSTDGLISLSSDGQTWITIADKNLGATQVWNSGDTLSETNAGKYYQRGNNYGFPFTGTIANQSTTQVDASNYGPGNYYSSDTFISYNGRWDSTDNGNLWGGVTQGTWQDCALTISAVDTTYTAGTGINIGSNNEISVDTSVVATQTDLQNGLDEKQDLLTAGDNITIEDVCTTESDMKGPCSSGFHVPTRTEWNTLGGILTTTFGLPNNNTTTGTYLKFPKAGCRTQSSGLYLVGVQCRLWTAIPNGGTWSYCIRAAEDEIGCVNLDRTYGIPIRPFKNSPAIPDNSWTTLYDGSSIAAGAGIFWDTVEGLISISGDGTTWYTMADKNIGATSTNINSSDSYGYYYQFGNNYGFPTTGDVTTSNVRVDVTGYGPSNPYSSSTYIALGESSNWSSTDNSNLWGGVSQSTHQECIHNVISATDTTYTASDFDIKDLTDSTGLRTTWSGKQDALTAGSHINITSNVISTTGLQEELIPGKNVEITFQNVINAKDTVYSAGENIIIQDGHKTESYMKGPCLSGWHIPSKDEADGVATIFNSLTFTETDPWVTVPKYLHLPGAGRLSYGNGNVSFRNEHYCCWTSSHAENSALPQMAIYFGYTRRAGASNLGTATDRVATGFPIRPFKNEFVAPDSSWTVINGTLGSAGIFRDQTNGLITITGDGTTGYTMADKNLGATTVYNYGDTLSEANCGGYFQRGNNYMFPFGGGQPITDVHVNVYDSTTHQAIYGPGNPYYSPVFVKTLDVSRFDPRNYGFDMWGGHTGGTFQEVVPNVISAVDTTYTAGTGISIDANNEISNTGVISTNNTYDNIIYLSQSDYDNLQNKDANTLYCTPSADVLTFVDTSGYSSSWDGDTQHAPSRDAVYDKIDAMDTTISAKANSVDVLEKTNTTSYTPTADYHPATKLYTDTHGPAIPVYSYHGDFSSDISCDVAIGGTYRIVVTGYHGGTINRDITITVDNVQAASYTSTVIETFCYQTVVTAAGGTGSTIVIGKSSNSTFTVHDVYIEKIDMQTGYITATVS